MVEAASVRWIGCDCGEQGHELVVLDERGQGTGSQAVANRVEALEEAFGRLVGESGGHELRVVLETQRSSGTLVAEVARARGVRVWTVPPLALRDFRRAEGQPRKDDPRDAYLLARMGFLALAACRPATEPLAEERRLCRLTRLRRQLVEQRAQALLRLRDRLVELAPALVGKKSSTPRWQSTRLRRLLGRYPALEGLAEAPVEEVAAQLRGVGPAQRQREAEALQRIASTILLPPAEREVVAFELAVLLDEILRLSATVRQLDAQIKRRVEEHPVGQRLLDVPGVGPFIAGVLIGELLSLARQVSEPRLATYAGVTPLNRKSGQLPGRSHLARATNKHALRALYQSGVTAIKHSSLDRAYYERQRARHQGHAKPHTVALIALARQRLKMLYKLLTTDQRYDKETLISSHLRRLENAA